MEISFLNNIKKYNSRNNKENITNVTNEAFRESEEFKNNVNEKLNSENKVLVRDFQMLERQYENTEVRSTTKDIITVVSSVQAGDFEARTGQDLTYLLSVEEWEEYYKKNLEFLKEKLGKNAHCVYAVVHIDESTPHLHSCWTFAEENKQENNEINYAKIDKALRNNFSNKNKKEMKLKAGTREYKKALAKYKEENMQKQVEKQLKKMQSRTSQKAFKCETGTSAINREFYRSINEEFKEKMKNEKVIQKLKKRIELFSNENCEIVKQRSEKYNNFETLDRAKHSMKTELEILADKINKNDYTEQELKRFKMINAKRILVEEKKAITIHDFKKKFKETKAKCRSIENNRTIAVGWNIINFKKNISNIIENNKKKKQLVNHFKEELKVLNNLKDTVNLKEIQEIIEKSTQGESAKDLINEKEQLKREIQDTKNEIYELNKRIMEKSRYDDKLNGQIYNKQLALGELSARVEEKRKEAEKPVAVSRERIRELEQEARQEARQRIERENMQKVKELEELKRNVEQQRQVQQMNEISIANHKKKIAEIKKESEEIEKKIAEKRNLSVEKLAEKSLKNAPVTNFEVDNYIEKNQEKFENLLKEREAEIENEIVEEMKEDTREAFSVFQNFVREYAEKIVYKKDLIDFKEAKRLTIQAFREIQATSKNFFDDFVENLKNKVNDLITMKQRQNSEKRPNLNENGAKKGKTR